jgi:8-oxo-dGTP pyrophosphatase MutT (NUDIX family)
VTPSAPTPSTSGPRAGEAFDPELIPVRDAATVMLIRDVNDNSKNATGGPGIEVFMMRRNLGAAFAGGMYAFPGGAVDEADRAPEVEELCIGRSATDVSALLKMDSGGLAWWVAVVRECFEEAGVLLAHTSDGATVRLDGPLSVRLSSARREVHDGSLSLLDLCRTEQLQLDISDVHYVAHWVTPVGERRRFDTRFFVAPAPAGQTPLHDGGETVDSLWVQPADALQRMARKELALLPPTVAMLRWLEPHHCTADVLAAAATIGIPPRILPELITGPDGKFSGVRLPDGTVMGA